MARCEQYGLGDGEWAPHAPVRLEAPAFLGRHRHHLGAGLGEGLDRAGPTAVRAARLDKNVKRWAVRSHPTGRLVARHRLAREAGHRPGGCAPVNQDRRQSGAPGTDFVPEQTSHPEPPAGRLAQLPPTNRQRVREDSRWAHAGRLLPT